MAENMLSARSDFGRTFNTAMWVIGAIAALQVFASGWAVISREPLPPTKVNAPSEKQHLTSPQVAAAAAGQPSAFPRPAASVPSDTGEYLSVAPVKKSVTTGEFTPAGESVPEKNPQVPGKIPIPPPVTNDSILSPPNMKGPAYSKSLGAALSDAASSVEKISDPLLERQVSIGEEFRSSGNMQGALKALKQVESALPKHPRVLAELAGTYSQMGLDEKALSYWEKVHQLGATIAGDYYPLAERALRGEQPVPNGAVTDILKIREVRVNKQAPGKDGQWVSLHVIVEGDPAVNPVGREMTLIVSFYDMVNGKKIETSTADTSQEFPTAPYDWQDKGAEEIEVIYHQPVFTEEEKRELGERVYHGYVIELYYRDQFQDTLALPAKLQELRIKEMNEGQKKAAKKSSQGLGGGLFPAPNPAKKVP